jgi:DNA polymerase
MMGGSLSTQQQHYLKLMGITVWLERKGAAASPTAALPVADGAAPGDWETLQKQVASCTRCELHRGRTQTVFGTGNCDADWLFIGEAPGAEEDRQGEPFVGRAGKLLNAMLEAMGLERKQVYIANILKCRPPDNRDPRPAEVAACEPYLMQQIVRIRPKIIVALGRIAAQNLLKIEVPIGRMRGQRYAYGDMRIPVVVTYHPAYLLRSPREKRKSWQDLQLAMKIYRESP